MASSNQYDNVRELAAAVILQAMEDYRSGPGRRGQYRLRQLEARDFLCGRGKFAAWRTMWCSEMGLAPDRLAEFVREVDARQGFRKRRSTAVESPSQAVPTPSLPIH